MASAVLRTVANSEKLKALEQARAAGKFSEREYREHVLQAMRGAGSGTKGDDCPPV